MTERLPLPEPLGEIVGIRASLHGVEFYGYFSDGLHQTEKLRVHTADQIHAYSDAENAALKRWKSTNAPRIEALDGLLKHAQIEAAKGAEAIASLASERAANAILTDENAALTEQVRVLREALESIKHDSEFFSVSHLRSQARIALEQK